MWKSKIWEKFNLRLVYYIENDLKIQFSDNSFNREFKNSKTEWKKKDSKTSEKWFDIGDHNVSLLGLQFFLG